MNEKTLRNRLEAALREELEARRRTLALVEREEAAIRENDRQALDAALVELESELARGVERGARLEALRKAFAALWSVDHEVLTLSSIAERLGERDGRIGELRRELRAAVCELLRKNRVLGVVVKLQRRALHEVVETVLEPPGGSPFQGAGNLLSAEA